MDVNKITLIVVLCSCFLLQNLQAATAVGVGLGAGVGVSPLLFKKGVIGVAVVKPVLLKKGLVVGTGAVIVAKGQALMAIGGSVAAAKGSIAKMLVTKSKSIGKAVIKAGTIAVKIPILIGGKVTSGTVALGKAAIGMAGNIAVKAKTSGKSVGQSGVGKAVAKQTNSIIAAKVKITKGALVSAAEIGSNSLAGLRATAQAGLRMGSAARQDLMGVGRSESHDLVSRRSDLIREHMRDIARTKGLLIGQYRAAISTSVKGSMGAALSSVKKTFSQGKAEKVKSVGSATGILGAIQRTISTVNQPNVIAEEKDFSVNKPVVVPVAVENQEVPAPELNPVPDIAMAESSEPLDDFTVLDSGAEEPITADESELVLPEPTLNML